MFVTCVSEFPGDRLPLCGPQGAAVLGRGGVGATLHAPSEATVQWTPSPSEKNLAVTRFVSSSAMEQ